MVDTDKTDLARDILKALFTDRVYFLMTGLPIDDGTNTKIDVQVRGSICPRDAYELLQPVMEKLRQQAEEEEGK